jgi:hypothetical protein
VEYELFNRQKWGTIPSRRRHDHLSGHVLTLVAVKHGAVPTREVLPLPHPPRGSNNQRHWTHFPAKPNAKGMNTAPLPSVRAGGGYRSARGGSTIISKRGEGMKKRVCSSFSGPLTTLCIHVNSIIMFRDLSLLLLESNAAGL